MSTNLDEALSKLQEKVATELQKEPEITAEPAQQEEKLEESSKLEPTEHEITAEPAQLSDIEKEAISFGWTPKEKFKGNPDDFVDAAEFMNRAPLYHQIHKLKKQNEKLEQGFQELARNYKMAEQRGREAMKAELLQAKQEAYITGDFDKASKLERQHEDMLKQDLQSAIEPERPQVTAEDIRVHPAWQAFAAENSWITGQDAHSKILQAKAQELANEFADALGSKYTIDHVPRHIEYIKANLGLKQPEKRAAAVVAPSTKPSSKSSKSNGFERLNESQKQVCRMACMGPNAVMTVDEYIKSLEANNSLAKE